MKRFVNNFFLFLIPVITFVVIVYAVPVDRKYAYNFVNKGGCENRSSWIYREVFEDTAAIDVVFIGTSHTMCAVDDEWLEKEINDSLHTHLNFRNIGYCGTERNLNYVMVRDVFQQKKPKLVVLEVRENESQSSHIYFGNIATTGDLFTAPLAWNRYYFRDVYMGFIFRLQHIRECMIGTVAKHQVDLPASPYGFNGGDRLGDTAVLYNHDDGKRQADFIEKGWDGVDLTYTGRIRKLANENKAKIVMVYLPAFAQIQKEQEAIKRYAPYGHVIIMPDSVLENKSNWQDEGHLNNNGARQFSPYFKNELIKALTGNDKESN